MFYKIYGSKWSKIAAEFSGMSENDIKNKFYSSLKSISSKLQNHESVPKHKKDLIQYVDIAIIHEELLPCKRSTRRSKSRRPKKSRMSDILVQESDEKGSIAELRNFQITIWPNSQIPETDVFTKPLSQMAWGEIEAHNNHTNTGLLKTNECLSRDEIKSNF